MKTVHLLLLVMIVLVPVQAGAGDGGLQPWFQDRTLRLDLEHSGTSVTEKFLIVDASEEGPWPGNPAALLDDTGYGEHQLRIFPEGSDQLIFSWNWSSLFGEWQTTEEAATNTRGFRETVRLPMPLAPVRVEIHSRDKTGAMVKVFEEVVSPDRFNTPDTRSHSRDPRRSRREQAQILELHGNGAPAHSLDVVILADGYTLAQQEKMTRDLKRFTRVLLRTPPFDRHQGSINVRGVWLASDRTGPAEPLKNDRDPTPLGSTFNTFGSARYLNTLDNQTIHDLAGLVPYDTIYIMVNTSRYGGAGIYNTYAVFVSDNEYDEYIFIHEFGHSFGGLGDEYYTSSTAYSDFYPRGVEPWEPNITAMLQGRESAKWIGSVAGDTPVPTPELPEYKDKTGVFEGAGYSAKGLYRPALDCKMFSKKLNNFCPVCLDSVERMILRQIRK